MNNQNENAEQGNWIKLSRSILDWEWYSDSNTFRVFIDLLLNAQYKDTRYRGNLIKRGQLITSVDAIKQRTGLSVQNIRTAINNLQSTGEINKQTNKHFTLVTICKYDTYQDNNEEGNKPTNNQITINQQSSNNIQEGKNIRKKEITTTTTGEQPTEMVGNSFKEIPSEEMKDYFQLKDVISRIQSFTNDKLDETALSFIKTKFFMIRNNAFTKKSGEVWDLLSFTNWLMKLLSEEGYTFNAKLQRPDSSNAQVFVPQNQSSVPAPFTKEELLSKISTERQEVIDVLLQKYDSFNKSGWKTSKGTDVDITFFTGYLLKQTKEALGVSKLPDYNKMDLKNFWK